MNKQLRDYVSQSRQAGKTDEQIRLELLPRGWDPAQIEESLKGNLAGKPGLYKKLLTILIIVAVIIFSVAGGYAALGKYLPEYAKRVQPYLGPVLDRIVGNNPELPEEKDESPEVATQKPNENLIEICHHASGNLANWHEISVASPSITLEGHLSHGDTTGKCPPLTIPTPTSTPKIPHPDLGKIISCNKNPAISNVDDRKIEDVKCLKDAIIKYYEDHDNYPISFDLDKSLGPYFTDGVPKDPVSGRNYYYAYRSTIKSTTKAFQVWAELEKYHPALETDSDFDSVHAYGWLGTIIAPYDDDWGSEKCIRPNPKGLDPLKEDLSKGSMMPDCAYDLKFDGYIPTSSNPVCAVYFGAGDPITYIKGPWTDDRQFTNSKEKCREYMEKKVLGQENCAQWYYPRFRILLLPSAKSHSYVMPPYGEAEYIYSDFCRSSQ